jgi:hypothetical protein
MIALQKSIRRLLIACWVLADVPLALAEEKPLFEEGFSEKLSEGWTWTDEITDSWQLIDGGLELKVLPTVLPAK